MRTASRAYELLGSQDPAVRRLEVQNVKRLPVVDDRDRLVGIVSRRDLLSIFLRDDETIRDEIVTDILMRTLRQDPSTTAVEVREGQVTLRGSVPYQGMIPAIVRMCSTVDGVVSVSEHLTYGADDTTEPDPCLLQGRPPTSDVEADSTCPRPLPAPSTGKGGPFGPDRGPSASAPGATSWVNLDFWPRRRPDRGGARR
ncbi:BON domain-containing protein [Streptomyces sp. NPDC059828]|uniref:BON domain-containing protein n=1 Tax=Streptomyces sp. NPDC059828 TaxID=3346965 RepID=UPI0036576FE9